MNPGRRRFLLSLGGLALTFGGVSKALAFGNMGGGGGRPAGRQYFTWAQLKYGPGWDPNPRGAERLLVDLRRRTSIEPEARRAIIEPGDPALFGHPFLCIAGRGGFPDLGEATAQWLARYVEYGGFIFIDDAGGVDNSPFLAGVERLLARAFPGGSLAPLPSDHTLYQAFYLLKRIGGRKVVRPVLTGLTRNELTPVIVCHNDLAGAFEGDQMGDYSYPCIPGGEEQREWSYRLGVNLVMYALCDNYKKDQVHIPFILKRRRKVE